MSIGLMSIGLMSMGFMSIGFPSFAGLRRSLVAAVILGLASAFTIASVGDAAARLGGGGSFGSRGSRTFSMPSATPTAPSAAPLSPRSGYGNQGFGSGYAQRPGFFSGGFGRGLLGGLVGAGLFGMLFGNGFGGGLGGISSIVGLILQLGLLYLLFRFVMGFFRGRQPAFGASAFGQAPVQGGVGGFGLGGGGRAPTGVPITIQPADYAAFEQRLAETQAAFSAEDLATLRRYATPEMAAHFGEELAANNQRGVINRLSDARLLQGDLAEAWREGGSEYATVAMKFSLIDTMVERSTGRIVSGNPTVPQVATEVWTFARSAGSGPDAWVLSAIQQA